MLDVTKSGVRNWKPDALPDLTGKLYVITGGNSGIGLDAARMLADKGADVVIAGRNQEKITAAAASLQGSATGTIDTVQLDLSDLSNVRAAAETVRSRYDKIDGLIDNAGIMQTPETRTVDGYELQLATNHLGHFLWAGLLLDLVEKAAGRIVTVSSIAHKFGTIFIDDLMLEKSYSPTQAYGQSKLANMLFGLELHRRLAAKGSAVKSIVCHPGYSNTALQDTGPSGAFNLLYKFLNPLMAQPSALGAIPTVLAAAGEEAQSGAYYGPTGWGDARGPVGDSQVAMRGRNAERAAWLWEESEKLVDFNWDALA
ncbi:SDR family NAD(P)-dependent oxidoreductase [Parasphingopyxis sp. CP4]|uniref:oxidoreductase n=1 Tax=Parasphingopyxis sp. CP4 TaxID=2724527 RepID=UPI00159FE357|nr:oxidoreductase [Parasphingopyxis sp. CP4]QLC22663.1 SDR family NAD(P)-dependent oxidoreductase [Parasphingopyxis sp. CP4]